MGGREGSETDGDANSMLCEIGTEAEAQNRDANLFDISIDEKEFALYINTVTEELGRRDDINQEGIIELCYFQEEGVHSIAGQDRDNLSTDILDWSPITREEQVLRLLRNGDLNSKCVGRLNEIVKRTTEIFHLPSERLPATNLVEHRIDLINEIPIYVRQYPIPQALEEFVRLQINILLETGIIEHSTSEYNSPIWVVPKADSLEGKRQWRLVNDYRKLNEKTVTMNFSIPNLTHIIKKLGGANYFIVADLSSGFHQIPLHKEARKFTAFFLLVLDTFNRRDCPSV